MDALPDPWTGRALRIVFTLAGAALLLNRWVRGCCIVLGCTFLFATLLSKYYYRNAKVFVGLLFFLIGLQDRGRPPVLIWWQLAVMYFGAGLNKFLELDWRTGHYFDYFLSVLHPAKGYFLVKDLLPGIWVARLMCWSIFVAELAAAAMFLFRRTRPAAVWTAAGVHAGAAILVEGDYGIFLTAVLVSYLAFLPWPEGATVTVGRGAWAGVAKLLRLLDVSGRFQWRRDDSARRLQVTAGAGRWSGATACGLIAVWTPLLHFAAMIAMTAPDLYRGPVVRGAGFLTVVLLLITAAPAWRRALPRAGSVQEAAP
jgi:hypothetical protein